MAERFYKRLLNVLRPRRGKKSDAMASLAASAAKTPDHLFPALQAVAESARMREERLRDMLERLGAPRHATKPFLLQGNSQSMAVIGKGLDGPKLELQHYGKNVALYVTDDGLVAVEDLRAGTPHGPYMTAENLLQGWSKTSPKMREVLAVALGLAPAWKPAYV